MNKSIIIHEFKTISKSKKNILFIISLIVLIFSYSFLVLPTKKTPDSFNHQEVKQEIEDIAAIQKGRESRGATGFHNMAGRAIYAEAQYSYKIKSKLVSAFEDQDFIRFTHLRMKDFAFHGITPDELIISKSPFPGKDTIHLYNQTILRYQGYLEEKLPITYKIIEQKTALQTIQNFLLSSSVLAILFCAIYFSSDMLAKDRQNRTILQGLPISWYRLINLKTFVSFTYTTVILAGLLLISVTVLTILYGFGSFDIHVPIILTEKTGSFGSSLNDYNTLSMAKFLIMAFSFLPILIHLFIRLNAVLSLLFKNAWLVLMISTAILFSERIYFSRTLRDLFGIKISNFPQTYFEFGKIVTGEKNYLVNIETITYGKGILVLMITLLILEIVLYAGSRIINKRRFYQGI